MPMIETHRCRVRGKLPARIVAKQKTRRLVLNRFRAGYYPLIHDEHDHKLEDFILYKEPDEVEEEELDAAAISIAEQAENNCSLVRFDEVMRLPDSPRLNGHQVSNDYNGLLRNNAQQFVPVSYNISDYVLTRTFGLNKGQPQCISEEYGTRRLLTTGILREFPICLLPPSTDLGSTQNGVNQSVPVIDKVFSSQWLDRNKVIMGTKCGKIKIYDTNKYRLFDVSTFPSLPYNNGAVHGIYSIELNPSRTLLATVGRSGKEVAFYRLPQVTPIGYGSNAHGEGILDLCWLDDDFLVSGGIDKQMALWRINEDWNSSVFDMSCFDPENTIPQGKIPQIAPLRLKACRNAHKVRAIVYNNSRCEIVSLSTNAYLHVWDPQTFSQVMSKKLPHAIENVCLTKKSDDSLYAVGSKSHFTLIDPRTLHHIKKVSARVNSCNVKSLSFHHDILTIGTAVGAVLFFDMRAGKYMESTVNSGRAVMLKCSRGFVQLEDAGAEMAPNMDNSLTVYTHCYDSSGTRLFVGGGPLDAQVRGHYAGIWQ